MTPSLAGMTSPWEQPKPNFTFRTPQCDLPGTGAQNSPAFSKILLVSRCFSPAQNFADKKQRMELLPQPFLLSNPL